MQQKKSATKRREFLKKASTVSLTVPVLASHASATDAENSYSVERVTGTVGPSSKGLTEQERRKFVEEMRDRYGPENTSALSVEPLDFSAEADVDGNLVHSVDGHVETDEAVSDHIIDIYETDVYTSDGARRYIYHHWSAANSVDAGWYEGNLVEFSNHVYHTSSSDLKQYAPASSITRNGSDVDISLKTEAQNKSGTGSASATGEATITVLEDTVEYDPNRTSTATDEFAVRWTGNYEGAQELDGFHVEQRPSGGIRSFDYTFELISDPY